MKKGLLATLAGETFINQAKQLFSSVYFNAGWKGDYMLLSYKIPQGKLRWFKDKGILIKECAPLYEKEVGSLSMSDLTKLCKFHLFTPEFKRWDNIIYLDADIIVRASLEELTKIKGFAAVQDGYCFRLAEQLAPKKKDKVSLDRLKEDYDLKVPSFNSGVMAFSTDIIKEDTFSGLKKLSELYLKITCLKDQPIFNLFFYKNWMRLPKVYNISPYERHSNIDAEKTRGIIIHLYLYINKPWSGRGHFCEEWKENLDRAESMDLSRTQSPRKKWTKGEIRSHCLYLKWAAVPYFFKHVPLASIDRNIGRVGTFLRHNFPGLYFVLKTMKSR